LGLERGRVDVAGHGGGLAGYVVTVPGEAPFVQQKQQYRDVIAGYIIVYQYIAYDVCGGGAGG